MEFPEKISSPYVQEFLCLPSYIFTSFLSVVLLAIIGKYYIFRDHGVPPGPTGVPLLGYWPFLKKDVYHLQFLEMKRKYGEIFSFRSGGKLFINLASYKVAREALIFKLKCFPERTKDYNLLGTLMKDAYSFSSKEKYKTLRKFFTYQLRIRGMILYKENTAKIMNDNIDSCINQLRKHAGEPLDIFNILIPSISHLLFCTLLGPESTVNESDIHIFIRLYEPFTSLIKNHDIVYLSGNIIKYFIFPFSKTISDGLKANRKTKEFFLNIIEDHKKSFKKGKIRDIIDSYIDERNSRKSKLDSTAKFFTDETLAVNLRQFLGDSIIDGSFFLVSLLMKLGEHEDVQENIFKELLEICGEDRNPCLQDNIKLAYTNAFLQEIQRTMFVPLFQGCECQRETTIGGYRIPKGSVLLVNLHCIHNDPKIYNNPEKFNPNRFLVKDGENEPEDPIVFGLGKNVCLGEGFVMMQAFFYCTAIVKNFHISYSLTNVQGFSVDMFRNLRFTFTPR